MRPEAGAERAAPGDPERRRGAVPGAPREDPQEEVAGAVPGDEEEERRARAGRALADALGLRQAAASESGQKRQGLLGEAA
ncbi:MAG: hypothetical protein DMD92_01610 [Candidatus Rokuibacteriota bacterium]|nr:MAG: hypothetical protein DMD92_01610 [Candidatus Rokubacteria bacterium]